VALALPLEPFVTVRVAAVLVATGFVATPTEALVWPAGTTIVVLGARALLLELRVRVVPPVGAGLARVTVSRTAVPPVVELTLNDA
jgi:hypothetical protein